MAMTLFRVRKTQHWTGQPEPGFAGIGRWHSAKRPILYLAETPALAALEWLKGKFSTGMLESEIGHAKLILLAVTVEGELADVPAVPLSALPSGWERVPNAQSTVTQAIGNDWLSSRRSLALRAPSATLPGGMGWNVLLNPAHAAYPSEFSDSALSVTPFDLAYYLNLP